MIKIDSIANLRAASQNARSKNLRIGLIPTMGNLHEGHISLLKKIRRESDFVITSIFVNPLQFGQNEDLAKYPRTLTDDQKLLIAAGCDVLFTPLASEMYPDGLETHSKVSVPGVSEGLCGDCRPGHFDGVATIVIKLLNIIQPDIAVFGQKDFQQLAVIKKFTKDLNISTQIIEAPTIRAADGLALSSRNSYLSPSDRSVAPNLYQCIKHLSESIKSGTREYYHLIKTATEQLSLKGFKVEYIEILNQKNLQPATDNDHQLIILIAAQLGKTRLIDNIAFSTLVENI